MQTVYERELQALKPWDQVQSTRAIGRGYNKIETAGHGYLVVPRGDIFASVARKIGASFSGKYAYYLEEDCEMYAFIDAIK